MNTNNKHTPGPWILTGNAGNIYPLKGTARIAVVDGPVAMDKTKGANANLIAAAPELLEALEAIFNAFSKGEAMFTKKRVSNSDPYHPANTMMCAAIAKAKGE